MISQEKSDPHLFGVDRSVFFFGVVEDRNDPLYLGRCKVRIFAVHPEDKTLVTTEQLPWAYPVMPITGNPGFLGMGYAPVGPTVGTHVVGFFADGVERQQPFFFGVIPGSGGHFNYGIPQPKPEDGSDGNSAFGPQGLGQLAAPINGLDKGSKDLTTRAAGFTTVIRTVMSKKYPKVKDFQWCAIAGNLWYESKGFQAIREIGTGGKDPANVPPPKGTKNVGYGWAQWTNTRLDSFLDYIKENSYAPDSDEAQLGYLLAELNDEIPGVRSNKPMFKAFEQGGYHKAPGNPQGPHNVDTIEGATNYFMGYYENPKETSSSGQRIQYSKIVLAALNKAGVPVRASSKKP